MSTAPTTPLILLTAAAAASAGYLAARVSDSTARDEWRKAATHDPLTGLANRTGWRTSMPAVIDRARRHRQPVAVCLADVDRLKTVNDTWGHLAGDQLLTTVAQRLRRHVGPHGLAARLGGDEFAAILTGPTGTPPEQWLDGARHQLYRALCGPADLGVTRHTAETSVGVALVDDDIDLSLAHADWAMYQAKHAHHTPTPDPPAADS